MAILHPGNNPRNVYFSRHKPRKKGVSKLGQSFVFYLISDDLFYGRLSNSVKFFQLIIARQHKSYSLHIITRQLGLPSTSRVEGFNLLFVLKRPEPKIESMLGFRRSYDGDMGIDDKIRGFKPDLRGSTKRTDAG